MEKRFVAWVLWNGRRPGNWTKCDHITIDDRVTLCGVKIPQDSFSYDHSGRGILCAKCEKAFQKLQEQ